MNRFPAYVAIILGAVAVSGCCPNGCFVLSGAAYRELAFPEPKRKRWERAGASDTQRQADWFACGGSDTGNFSPEATLLDRVQETHKVSQMEAYSLIYDDVQRCMLRKGYHYIGACDTEIRRTMPACGAP
jgi:hypothetical protein